MVYSTHKYDDEWGMVQLTLLYQHYWTLYMFDNICTPINNRIMNQIYTKKSHHGNFWVYPILHQSPLLHLLWNPACAEREEQFGVNGHGSRAWQKSPVTVGWPPTWSYQKSLLVAGCLPTPLKKIRVSHLGWLFHSQYMEKYIKMFQTTNQL